MKKYTTLVMGLTAVFALTACGGKGTKVSEEQFKEKAGAVEEHQYTSAVAKYEFHQTSKTNDKADDPIDYKGTVEFTFKDGKWSTESKDENLYLVNGIYEENVKQYAKMTDISAAMAAFIKNAEINLTFYTNPFGIEYTLKATIEEETELLGVKVASKTVMDNKDYTAFDKYGYVTKQESTSKTHSEYGLGENATVKDTESTTKITVSYK